MFGSKRILAALALGIGLAGQAHAQLVIDGETITSAETLAAGLAEGRFVHYGAYPADPMKIIHDAFTADTGIAVEHIRMVGGPLYQRVTAEYEAGDLMADVVDLTDHVLLGDLVERGILDAPYKVSTFDAIPTELKDPEGRWYSYVNPIWTVGVNTARIDEADYPTSWEDLLDPKYDGKLATVSVEGGSGFALHSFLRDKISPDYWSLLAARKPRIYESVAPLTSDLARGDVGIVIGSPEQILAQAAAGAPLKAFFFAEGTPSFPVAGGITSVARNPNAAKVFMDWITSKRGSDTVAKAMAYGILLDSDNPVLEGTEYPDRSQLWSYDPEKWRETHASGREEWRALFGR